MILKSFKNSILNKAENIDMLLCLQIPFLHFARYEDMDGFGKWQISWLDY